MFRWRRFRPATKPSLSICRKQHYLLFAWTSEVTLLIWAVRRQQWHQHNKRHIPFKGQEILNGSAQLIKHSFNIPNAKNVMFCIKWKCGHDVMCFFSQALSSLIILDLYGNPLVNKLENYRIYMVFHLPSLKALDGAAVVNRSDVFVCLMYVFICA